MHFLECKKFLNPKLRRFVVHPWCPNLISEVHFGVTSLPLVYPAIMQYVVHRFSPFSKSHFLAQVNLMYMWLG